MDVDDHVHAGGRQSITLSLRRPRRDGHDRHDHRQRRAAGGNVPITAGFTGAWYDPHQSGHGIFIEVLPNNQILAWWFTFTPDGTQTWFGNVGDDRRATRRRRSTRCRRRAVAGFRTSIRPTSRNPSWGTLTFTFTDCDHGRVDFDSTVAGLRHRDTWI